MKHLKNFKQNESVNSNLVIGQIYTINSSVEPTGDMVNLEYVGKYDIVLLWHIIESLSKTKLEYQLDESQFGGEAEHLFINEDFFWTLKDSQLGDIK